MNAPAAARDPRVIPRTYLTADIPPLGGVIKQRPEDFLVDEVPLYEPSGAGEHLVMLVEKRNLSTFEMLDVLARHFGVEREALGTAGLKDKVAITRQVVTVHTPKRKLEDFPSLRHERIGILWADYHANKLRRGHLKGNRFSIRIRNVNPMDARNAKRVLDRLAAGGVPNRFGEQRFGAGLNNHLIARALVLGDFEGAAREMLVPGINPAAAEHFAAGRFDEAMKEYPATCRAERRVLAELVRGRGAQAAFRALDKSTVSFYMSALQSAVFNAVLDTRLDSLGVGALREGDLAMKLENRAVFRVDAAVLADPATAERLARREISPSGPMWGEEMMRAAGATDADEVAALVEMGLTPDGLIGFAKQHRGLLTGERRPLRIPVIDPDVEGGLDEHGPFVRVAFELPRGGFATTVLKEIMKPAAPAAPAESEHAE